MFVAIVIAALNTVCVGRVALLLAATSCIILFIFYSMNASILCSSKYHVII